MKQSVARIRQEIVIYRAVAADPRCPRLSRWLLGGAVAYAISPIDLIPDFIPVLGHLDDLLILPLLVWLATRMIPREVIAHHRRAFQKASKKIHHGSGEELAER